MSVPPHHCNLFFLVVRNFKIYSLSHFLIHSTVLLMTVPGFALHPRTHQGVYTRGWCLCTHCTHFTHPPSHASVDHQCVPCVWELGCCFKCQGDHMAFVFLSLIYFINYYYLLLMPSRSVCVVTNGKCSFLLPSNTPLCTHTTASPPPLLLAACGCLQALAVVNSAARSVGCVSV